jgi:hypothetical protein
MNVTQSTFDRRRSKPRRQTAYRSVIVELACGCEHEQTTSYLRLSAARAATIANGLARRGVWCTKSSAHAGIQSVVKYLGTRRT